MSRSLLPSALALFLLAGCGSSAPAVSALASRADAASAVSEAERAVERAEADSARASELDEARQEILQATAMLASGATDEAVHRAYLARQLARIATLEAEIDAAEQAFNAQGSANSAEDRFVVTDLFQSGRVTIKPESRAAVDRVAAYLTAHPEVFVLIESFTDATGDERRNQTLSESRAEAVQLRLVGAGVEASRIVTAGYGQGFPVAPNDTAANRRQNRRIEFSVADSAEALVRRAADAP